MRDCPCGKRCYLSEQDAHYAMRHAGFRYRLYRCPYVGRYLHTSASEKRENRDRINAHNHRERVRRERAR